MKSKFKYYTLWLVLVSPFIINSCSDDFLDVADPTVLSKAIFPKTVDDLEFVLIDLYGRLYTGYFSDNFRTTLLSSHEDDHGYNGAEFNEMAQILYNPNLVVVQRLWEVPYLAVGKCNQFISYVEEFRNGGTLTAAELERLDQMEGEARFLRALNYFYLINLYGESPIWTEADKQKMGIPLWETKAGGIDETAKPRATQGQVFDFIIADLKAAETLLEGVVFDQKPRVNEWAVKSLLGKTYVYTLQYDLAKTVLKDVIDNSGKELVSYELFHDMFHGRGYNEYNKESIFEENATPDKMQSRTQPGTGQEFPRYIAVTYIDANGNGINNGFCNLAVHDMNIPRFGFDDTTCVDQTRPDYVAKSIQVRLDKSVDPRLYISAFQPFYDSIPFEGVWRKLQKNFYEGYSNIHHKAWSNSKYTAIDYSWRSERYTRINFIILRLADVYLLYAESLIKTGSEAEGLEWINKVHRRAYDQPVDVPSIYDYATLSDRTKTVDPTDPLANDVLKYERWAELFGEGNWWFDVRRWDLGAEEAAYYKTVMSGPLEWSDHKYAWPIPTSEMNSNNEIIQNPGF